MAVGEIITIISLVVAAAVAAGTSYYAGVESKKSSKRQAAMLESDKQRRQKERALRTRRLASGQKASFLASGISLTGEGTAATMLDETFTFGKEEIENIGEKYSKQQEAVLAKGRSDYNLGLVGLFTGVSTTAGMIADKTSGWKAPKDVKAPSETRKPVTGGVKTGTSSPGGLT